MSTPETRAAEKSVLRSDNADRAATITTADSVATTVQTEKAQPRAWYGKGVLGSLISYGRSAIAGVKPSSSTKSEKISTADRVVLKEEDAYHVLGFSFPTWKKWAVLTSVFIVQISMNFNAAIYGNAGAGMVEEFDIPYVLPTPLVVIASVATTLSCLPAKCYLDFETLLTRLSTGSAKSRLAR